MFKNESNQARAGWLIFLAFSSIFIAQQIFAIPGGVCWRLSISRFKREITIWISWPLSQPSSGSSNDGSSWDTFRATEPLAIRKISFPFDEPIENRFSFTISGKQTEQSLDSLNLPIHLEKETSLTLRVNFKEKSFLNPFAFAIRISGTTEEGRPFTNYAHYNLFSYLTQDDVKRIIEEKTRRGSGE